MAKTPSFHCRGHRFDPWSETKIPYTEQCGQNKMNKKLSGWQPQEFQNNSCSSLSPGSAASDLYSTTQSVTLSEPLKLTWVEFALRRTWVCHGLCECAPFPERSQSPENGAVSGGQVSSGCRKINWLQRTTLTSCSQVSQLGYNLVPSTWALLIITESHQRETNWCKCGNYARVAAGRETGHRATHTGLQKGRASSVASRNNSRC